MQFESLAGFLVRMDGWMCLLCNRPFLFTLLSRSFLAFGGGVLIYILFMAGRRCRWVLSGMMGEKLDFGGYHRRMGGGEGGEAC